MRVRDNAASDSTFRRGQFCLSPGCRIAPRRRLRETGIVAGEDLTPQKARILLALMLTTTRDIAEIQKAFQSY